MDLPAIDVSAILPSDGLAALLTLVLALCWLRSMDFCVAQGWVEPKLSRKIIHIGTGPLFVLCWPFFSDGESARYWAALVPLCITLQFLAVGLGIVKDPAAVQAMTRSGQPQEILRGPLFYGLVFVACTVGFWRTSAVGILALMMLCGGDGLADIVGRRWGVHKLPFSSHKSWVGSLAMFLGSAGLGGLFLWLFQTWGYFPAPLLFPQTWGIVAAIAIIATLVEALPFRDIDNLTLTGVVLLLGQWWL